MLLTRRVNVILLPVIVGFFLTLSIYTFDQYKRTLTQSGLTALSYELESIQNDFSNNIQFMSTSLDSALSDKATRQFLLSNTKNSGSMFDVQLTDVLNTIELPFWNFDRLTIVNDLALPIYHFDRDNPFSEFIAKPQLQAHIDHFYQQLPKGGTSLINPYSFCLQRNDKERYRMFIYRSFSPNQVMARNRYSINMPLYTAIFEATFTTSERYLKQLQKSFGHYAQLNIESVDCVENFENRSLRIQSSSVNDKLLVESKEQLANFAVSVDKGYLDQRLTPYRNTIIKTVGIGVLLAFLLLKALIHQQVLTPVLKLTKQVNKAIDGEINELKPSLQHDEVAMLNNGYVTLLGRLTKMAKYDNLTGLANRRLFDNHLDAFLNRSRSDQGKGALFFIDLDNFKQVNDTYGHSMGDALLADFANQLSKLFRYGEVFSLAPNDHSIARLAGDEFAVLLDGMPNTQAIAIAAQRVTSLFNGGYTLQGKVLDVHASIGIAVFPDDANTKEVLTSRADAAMYQVKRSGKNGFQFYSQELEHEAMQSTQIEAALHRALAEDNFHLNFMPIYATSDLQLTGFEVLLRSNCPILAQFGPAQFIPVAESTGIIKQLDYYVIEQALAHCRRLIDDHEFAGVMAINFSAWQLRNPEFTSVVKGLIEQYQVPPHQLELEITETCTVDNSESATELLHSLKQLNVKLSLDDFGTGYTAFKQLLNFPVDTIKIDRSFIAIINDLEESSDKAIIKILAELASLYQLDAVAEGVETQTQLEFVRSVGIQRVQGYLLSKPINYDQLVAMIAQGQKESNHH